jgi:Fe-Mn family superoxide dismutase
MTYQAKQYDCIAKGLEGLTPRQLQQHYGLYEGYVKKINEIDAKMPAADLTSANATYAELRELQVEQTYALNGVVLHEFFFSGLVEKNGEPSGELARVIDRDHGGLAKWADRLKAVGKCARGWVIFGLNTRDAASHFYLLDFHNVYMPALVIPIIVLDTYEHAYMIDYGTNRAGYLDTYVKHINWVAATKRWDRAVGWTMGPATTE